LDTNKRVSALRKEIEILFMLGEHSSIVHLIEVLEDSHNVYLVFEEHVGDLHSYIVSQGGKLSEEEVMCIFPQILSAVSHCHQKGIVHRDLKLENILYSYSGSATKREMKVFLADFGFATFYDRKNANCRRLTKWCGSPFTVAPEIIERTPYLPEPVDVWSLGSMLYTMLCGYPPFKAKTVARVFKRTQKGKMRPFPRHVGFCARNLLKKMLVVNPQKRAKLEDLKEHPWFKFAVGVKKSGERKLSTEYSDEGEMKKSRSMLCCGLSSSRSLFKGSSRIGVAAK